MSGMSEAPGIETPSPNLAPLVAAAEQALTRALGRPVRLGEVNTLTDPDRRNVVLRCRNLAGDDPASVIIKRVVADDYNPDNTASWDVRRFYSDWAGAEFLSALPGAPDYCPRFYAGDRALGLFILEDLGPHRSLVQPLLEEDAASATAALCAYAITLGQMHAATIGQSDRFERLRQALYPAEAAAGKSDPSFAERVARLRDRLDQLGVRIEPGFEQDIDAVSEAMSNPGPFRAYIHGDPCPDNMFFVDGRMRLIDFEFGRFDHALVDAAYARMMFPTCWCANRLPGDVVAQAERVYRAELVAGCPEAQDDRVFETALVCACASWLLTTLEWLLEDGLKEDHEWGIATIRQRLLARPEAFIATAEEFGQLTALRGTASRLVQVLRQRWPDVTPLPLYPAFANSAQSE